MQLVVVLSAPIGITKYAIGHSYGLKALLVVTVTAVFIGVQLGREAAIGPLNIGGGGRGRYSQHLVMILTHGPKI